MIKMEDEYGLSRKGNLSWALSFHFCYIPREGDARGHRENAVVLGDTAIHPHIFVFSTLRLPAYSRGCQPHPPPPPLGLG